MAHDYILREELQKVLDEIRELYESSGKRTSGQFAEGLELREIDPQHIELWGYSYLAGRPAGKMPPVAAIKKWVEQKGIKPIQENMTVSSLAWAIAKKIQREGTDEANQLLIYDKVLTPARIDSIINKVSQFNANLFAEEITTYMVALTQKYSK